MHKDLGEISSLFYHFGELRHEMMHWRINDNLAILSIYFGMRVSFCVTRYGTAQVNQVTGKIFAVSGRGCADEKISEKEVRRKQKARILFFFLYHF